MSCHKFLLKKNVKKTKKKKWNDLRFEKKNLGVVYERERC